MTLNSCSCVAAMVISLSLAASADTVEFQVPARSQALSAPSRLSATPTPSSITGFEGVFQSVSLAKPDVLLSVPNLNLPNHWSRVEVVDPPKSILPLPEPGSGTTLGPCLLVIIGLALNRKLHLQAEPSSPA